MPADVAVAHVPPDQRAQGPREIARAEEVSGPPPCAALPYIEAGFRGTMQELKARASGREVKNLAN